MNIKEYRKSIVTGFLAISMLISCGGGKSSSSGSNSQPVPVPDPAATDASIVLVAPDKYPSSSLDVKMPVIVRNAGNSDLTNLNLVTSSDSLNSVTVDSNSLKTCSNIASGSDCVVMVNLNKATSSNKVVINANAKSGIINANPIKATTNSKVLQAESVVTSNTNLLDIPSNKLSGISGVTFLTSTQHMASDGIILFTAVVSSPNAGQFNDLKLFDAKGNEYNTSVLTGNAGPDASDLTEGSIVTLAIRVPLGTKSIEVYPQQYSHNAPSKTLPNKTTSPIVINDNSSEGIINGDSMTARSQLDLSVSDFELLSGAESYTMVINNSGNSRATNLHITTSSSFVSHETNCLSELAAGSSCNYTVKFDSKQQVIGSSSVLIEYNNGSMDASKIVNFNYRGTNVVGGIALSLPGYADNSFSTVNTASTGKVGVSDRILIIKNTGTAPIKLTNINLPTANLNYANANDHNYTNCTIGMTLAVNSECASKVSYSSADVASSAGFMSVDYSYTEIDNQIINSSSELALSWQTSFAQALLSLNKDVLDFGFLLNNNIESHVESLVITNIGAEIADVDLSIDKLFTADVYPFEITSMFHMVSNSCGTQPIQIGQSCTLQIRAGSISPSVIPTYIQGKLKVLDKSNGNWTASALLLKTLGAKSAAITTEIQSVSNRLALESSGLYQYAESSIPNVLLKITNVGPVSAVGLKINESNLVGWNKTFDSCGSFESIPADAWCQVRFEKKSAIGVGAQSLDLSKVIASWTDQDSPQGESQPISSTVINMNGVANPKLTTSVATNMETGKAVVNVTLQGGYNVLNQIITASLSSNLVLDTSAGTTSSTCTLKSSSPNCVFNVKLKDGSQVDTTFTENVSFTNSGTVAISGSPTVGFSLSRDGVMLALGSSTSPLDARNMSLGFDKKSNTPHLVYSKNSNARMSLVKYESSSSSWVYYPNSYEFAVGEPDDKAITWDHAGNIVILYNAWGSLSLGTTEYFVYNPNTLSGVRKKAPFSRSPLSVFQSRYLVESSTGKVISDVIGISNSGYAYDLFKQTNSYGATFVYPGTSDVGSSTLTKTNKPNEWNYLVHANAFSNGQMSVLYTPDGSTSEENRSFQNFGVFVNDENIGASVPNISSCGTSTLLSFIKGNKIYVMKNDNNGASWLPTSPWYTIYTSTKTGYVVEDMMQSGNQPKVAGNGDCSIIYIAYLDLDYTLKFEKIKGGVTSPVSVNSLPTTKSTTMNDIAMDNNGVPFITTQNPEQVLKLQ